jgi:hypothetical protein
MLSGVLNSEIALKINIEIIQTFIDSCAAKIIHIHCAEE